MTPPATEHAVPIAVMVLGWTPRLTSQFATGSMTRRYPFFSQSGRIFIRFRHAAQRAGQQATGRAASRVNAAGWSSTRLAEGEARRSGCENRSEGDNPLRL